MNRSTVVPALIGIGAALVLLLVVGGGILGVMAVQSALSSAGSSSSRDDSADDDEPTDEGDPDDADPGSSSDSIDGLTIGSGDIEIVGYFDFACPICASFVDTNADQVRDWVEDDEVTLTLHPVSILDRSSTTEYSTRAAAAMACQAEINPELAIEYFFILFDAQPAEQGDGLDDAALIDLSDNFGGDSIADCVENGDRYEWVAATTEQAMADGLTGTPWVLVDDEQYDGARDDAAEFAAFVGL